MKSLIMMTLSLVLLTTIIGCSAGNLSSADNASKDISDSLGCDDVKSKIFDAFYKMVGEDQNSPEPLQLNSLIENKIDHIFSERNLTEAELKNVELLKTELGNLVDQMLSEREKNPNLTFQSQLQNLIELEMEDQSNAEIIKNVKKVNVIMSKIKSLSQILQLDCAVPTNPVASVPATAMSKGLNMVFATAYQSCHVLDLPPMNALTPRQSGIKVVPQGHSSGRGSARYIVDLPAVQSSHYYVREIASDSKCLDVRKSPLIYDFGGKASYSKTAGILNFQKDAGTGTEVLGVDCSGYVSAAIAVAGLRYSPGLENKPVYTNQGASKFANAVKSNFKCFDNITVSPQSSIKPGDIVGVDGHVVAIDSFGEDPFGLNRITKESDCSKLSYKNFDIVVSQSSPSKNGIGLNKYVVKDYLDESDLMAEAFVGMGKVACQARFQKKEIKPETGVWGFIRHKGTPECLAPRVSMVGEACTQKCF